MFSDEKSLVLTAGIFSLDAGHHSSGLDSYSVERPYL